MALVATERLGFELPLLLAGAFRATVDSLHAELARRGHPEARPLHGFVLQAVGPDGATVSEVARRLGVSKQAAAKTIVTLDQLGYLVRAPHAADARAVQVRRSPRGEELLALSAEALGRIHQAWEANLGAQRLDALEDDLARIAGPTSLKTLGDLPGWLR